MLALRRWLIRPSACASSGGINSMIGAMLLLIGGTVVLWNRNPYLNIPEIAQPHHGDGSMPAYFAPYAPGCFVSPDNKILGDIKLCADFPTQRLPDVQIVIKTGYAERQRLAMQLETFASCITNLLVLSDAPDQVAGHDVIDLLAELPPSYAENNPEWAFYAAQRQKIVAGEKVEKSQDGWKLDRFKFLSMVDKAYKTSPHAKWYVFIETDIYYFWDSLFRVLDRLDPNERHYLGSPAPGTPDFWFAYGGAGIVLSSRLVRDLVQDGRQRIADKYEQLAKDDPSGDAILGYAIDRELGARLGHLYPTFPGEDLPGLRITNDKWCTPIVGLHRVSDEQMAALWAWERCRFYTDEPLTYSTFLDFAISPLLRNGSQVSFWNNGANDGGEVATGVDTLSACSDACKKSNKCLQYMHEGSTCHLADYIQLGRSVPEDVMSGWDDTKLESRNYHLYDKLAPTCKQVRWLKPKVGKPFP